jgi:hypothetical protein
MLTLYRASHLLSYWVAHSDRLGWVMFPARPDGWKDRRVYAGETARLMRIPARLGFNTGFPHPDATPVRTIDERLCAEIREVKAPVRRVA